MLAEAGRTLAAAAARTIAPCSSLVRACGPLWWATPKVVDRPRHGLARLELSSRPPRQVRGAASSSSSSTRWRARQGRDVFAREAKVAGLKSRAAFKLLEINDRHRLFRPGQTVVDLGFAPGSWSQVAVNRTAPGGRVVGIDVIPAHPPRGVNTLQGDFLSPAIREQVRRFVADPSRGRPRTQRPLHRSGENGEDAEITEAQLEEANRGIIELEKAMEQGHNEAAKTDVDAMDERRRRSQKEADEADGRVVDVVLSDMMMNTSGMSFRDHAGSMDLCLAALEFCYDTLATGGHFLCKFYQGAEDPALEKRLKRLFDKVHRIKPDSSRKESREAYFVALRRKAGVPRDQVLSES